MKGYTPSLVDIIVTNKESSVLLTGISDCHNLISVTIKGNVHVQKLQKITYRSYKNIDIDNFNLDLDQIELSYTENITTSEQVNDGYIQYINAFTKCLEQTCSN